MNDETSVTELHKENNVHNLDDSIGYQNNPRQSAIKKKYKMIDIMNWSDIRLINAT